MSRFKGTFIFGANLEGASTVPIDARQLVGTYSDLTLPATWCFSPTCSTMALYNGMMTVVPSGSCSGIYWLCDAANYMSASSWVKAGSGTGTITGGTNGIFPTTSCRLALGGALTGNTTFSNGVLQYSTHPNFSGLDYAMVDKQYVDDVAAGLKPKAAVIVATTGNTTYPFSGLMTIDGISLSHGDRVLIKNQTPFVTSGKTNGIYVVNSGGTWSRATDFDGTPPSETVSGAYMWVLSGNTNANTAWVLDTPDPIIIYTGGTSGTSLNFVLFAHVADVVGENGITVTMQTGTHTIKLGGALTGDTALTGAYTLSICGGAKLNTTCGYQISGSTILKQSPITDSSIYIGCGAGNLTSTGVHNTVIGCGALSSITSGGYNVAIGNRTLGSSTTAANNTAVGYMAAYAVTGGSFNVALGHNAYILQKSGSYNIAIGYQAMNGIGVTLNPQSNVAIGATALYKTCGNYNVAVGGQSQYQSTFGCENTTLGYNAGSCITSGCQNVAVGSTALYRNTTGNYNIGVGACAMTNNRIGLRNTAIGHFALNGNFTNSQNINDNTAIGFTAGYCVTGNSNVFIGSCAGYFETGSNKLYIANSDTTQPLIYGDFATKCAIVHGAFKISGATSLLVAPVSGTTSDEFLVWNSGDKLIKKISSTTVLSSAITGATNGLGTTGKRVCLGGTLTSNTIILGACKTLDFGTITCPLETWGTWSTGSTSIVNGNISKNGTFSIAGSDTAMDSTDGTKYTQVYAQAGYLYLQACDAGAKTCLNICCNNIVITGPTGFGGAKYFADYSANYTARSLVDKAYVTGFTQNTINVHNISTNYTATCSSDFIGITGGTAICVTLPASPKPGQKITVSDVCGCATIDNICVLGNGRTIAGSGIATINTDFGSMTFVNNNTGTSWSAVSFVM